MLLLSDGSFLLLSDGTSRLWLSGEGPELERAEIITGHGLPPHRRRLLPDDDEALILLLI